MPHFSITLLSSYWIGLNDFGKGDGDVKIGYRTIKTAIGVPVAILIAQFIGLSNFISPAILTILSIKPSRKKSFISAWDRFACCMIGILLSFLFFEFISYHPFVIGLLLIVFIPITVYFKITQGIVTSSVIILNLFSKGYIDMPLIGEQILVILIGIGTALILNLYMPSLEHKLLEYQKELEKKIQKILFEIARYIRDESSLWDGKELLEASDILEEATILVATDKENHLLRNEHSYDEYFSARRKQLDLLRRMIPLVSRIDHVDLISDEIANFFEDLSAAVSPQNTATVFLEQLNDLREVFRTGELPATRKEFEIRANLFRLLHEIEEYLTIKSRL